MKLFTLKRNPKDPKELEVHLELVASFRAVAGLVWAYGSVFLIGFLAHRAYLIWINQEHERLGRLFRPCPRLLREGSLLKPGHLKSVH